MDAILPVRNEYVDCCVKQTPFPTPSSQAIVARIFRKYSGICKVFEKSG